MMIAREELPEYQLTNNLLKTLEESQKKFDKYIEYQKKLIDERAKEFHAKEKKEQSAIQDLTSNLERVQSERGLSGDNKNVEGGDGGIAQKHHDMNSRRRQLSDLIEKISQIQLEKEHRVKELKDEELYHRAEAKDAIEHNARINEAKTTTVEDLTKGIINYNKLGIKFVKAPNGLRFSFTQLNEDDPKKEYSFTLAANQNDVYEVHDCHLPEGTIQRSLNTLNEDEDLFSFTIRMRREFLDKIVA